MMACKNLFTDPQSTRRSGAIFSTSATKEPSIEHSEEVRGTYSAFEANKSFYATSNVGT